MKPTTKSFRGANGHEGIVLLRHANEPTSSWWIGLSREEFVKQARDRELLRMQNSRFGVMSDPKI